MWDVACPTDVPIILSSSSHGGSFSMDKPGPLLPSRTEMTGHVTGVSSASCLATPTLDQFALYSPEPPHVPLQLSTEQPQAKPLVHALDFASHRRVNVHPEDPQSHWRVVAGPPQRLAVHDRPANPSPFAASLPGDHYEVDFRPDVMWSCPYNPIAPDISHAHESYNPSPGAVGSNPPRPTSLVRPEQRYDRVTGRHQRLSVSHPYAVSLAVPNHIDTLPSHNRTETPTQLPLRTEGGRILTSTDPDWRLTLDTYNWLFAVMYPKRRPDKTKPTPSGSCQLCDSTCKRAGILQQHLTILHRQRIARKYLAGNCCNLQLAFAFVVAQVLCDVVKSAQMDPVYRESRAFLGILKSNPTSLYPLQASDFPSLYQKLGEFSRLESWVGVQCVDCGMWATRRVALEEHAAICTGTRRGAESPSLEISSKVPIRLTASGLAARPNRGSIPDQ